MQGKYQNTKKSQVVIISAAALIASSLPSLIFNASIENIQSWMKFNIVIVSAAVFVLTYEIKNAALMYIKAMTYLSSVSLMVYAVANLGILNINLPEFTNVNGMLYKNGLIFFVYDDFLMWRNIGPFWEPGIFGSYLYAALLINIVYLGRIKSTSNAILIIAMITTMSAAAFMLMIFIPLIYLTNKTNKSTAYQAVLFIPTIALSAGFLYNLDYLAEIADNLIPSVFSKFLYGGISVSDRLESPITNMNIYLSSPVAGYGLTGFLDEYVILTDSPQTSTMTALLSAFGITGIIYTLLWIVAVLMNGRSTIIAAIIVLISVAVVLNKEPHYYFTLTYIIMFYMLKSILKTGCNRPYLINCNCQEKYA